MKNLSKPQITVIIPYYFQIKIVEETLSKLYNQALNLECLVEVLIVDSNTNSSEIIIDKNKTKNLFLNVKIINTKNSLSRKRNVGINHANSDYLVFLDDDVIPSKNFIKSFLEISKNNEFFTSCLVDFEEPKNAYLYYRKRKENSVKWTNFKGKVVNPIFCTAMAFGANKELIIKNKQFFDENFKGYGWEDVDFFIQAEKKGIKLNVGNIYVTHRELSNYKKYFKKQILMGSWYEYFLEKHPKHAKKIKIYILFKFKNVFRLFLPFFIIFFKLVESFFRFKMPFNSFSYYLFEIYFKYANILGMLSEPIKYDC